MLLAVTMLRLAAAAASASALHNAKIKREQEQAGRKEGSKPYHVLDSSHRAACLFIITWTWTVFVRMYVRM